MEHASYDRHGELIRDPFIKKLKRVLSSSLVLFIAFVITNVVYQLITWLIAHIIGYKIGINYNGVNFSHDNREWSKLRILAVDLPSPVFCLVTAGLLFRLLTHNPQWINLQRLLVFWLMVCFANLFFANLVSSPIELSGTSNYYYNHFSCMAAWMGLGAPIMIIVAFIALAGSVVFGMMIGREVLRFCFSKGLVTTQSGKSSIILQYYILPVVISALPLALLGKEENILMTGLTMVNMIAISLGMMIRAAYDTKIVRCNKQDILNHVPLMEAAVASIMWVGIYFWFRG